MTKIFRFRFESVCVHPFPHEGRGTMIRFLDTYEQLSLWSLHHNILRWPFKPKFHATLLPIQIGLVAVFSVWFCWNCWELFLLFFTIADERLFDLPSAMPQNRPTPS